ncbi:MAG: hypothetical protein H6741_15515 [Alphaproteobacteria bacterium]|nr:hypothetical protein [Alphaproteobacteria bacterium]
MSRPRVCQVLKLLELAPAILAEIDDPLASGPIPPERKLYKVAQERAHEVQLARYRALVQAETPEGPGGRRCAVPSVCRPGLQHVFEEARRWQEMLNRGEARSMAEIARGLGVSEDLVVQTVLLLHLHPEIIAVLDVPADKRPPGLTIKALRSLARIRDPEEQLRRFDRMLVEGAMKTQAASSPGSAWVSSQARPEGVSR